MMRGVGCRAAVCSPRNTVTTTVRSRGVREFRHFARYCSVGLLSVGLNTLIILWLTKWVGLNYLWAVTICFLLVTAVGFILNRGWTFDAWKTTGTMAWLRYGCTAAVQLTLSLVCCYLAVRLMHLPYAFIAIFLSAVFAPLSYLVHRRWSFRSIR